ncbi:hypothetical protein L227DRAFT_439571 [Lentinus tigrinus ALCF2SS1-6]|uniref:Uncharacterized protein n=1 Tax=Lentinus tigrinus ALCF2SS1-6 TaxID=1328759 RepID=A0A5C2RPG7_9APHY|nr:hypothetical protein L227DRAFT_439571 [Lentinus tigrinus ALCF2SS1-6]
MLDTSPTSASPGSSHSSPFSLSPRSLCSLVFIGWSLQFSLLFSDGSLFKGSTLSSVYPGAIYVIDQAGRATVSSSFLLDHHLPRMPSPIEACFKYHVHRVLIRPERSE